MPRTVLVCVCGHECAQHNMERHKRTCKQAPRVIELEAELARKDEELKGKDEELKGKDDELKGKDDELQRKNQEIERLSLELAAERDKPKIIIGSITNTVNLVAFGNEPIPTRAEVLRSGILNAPERSIARYIEMKHFCNAETANLRLTNKRARTMQVVEEDMSRDLRWTERDKAEMIDTLAVRNMEELVDVHEARRHSKWGRWYDALPDEGFDKTATWRRTVDNIEHMLLSRKPGNRVHG